MLALPKGVEAISWVVASASILSKVGGRSRWQRVLPRVCPVADGGIMESLSYKSSESMRDWNGYNMMTFYLINHVWRNSNMLFKDNGGAFW